MNVEVNVTNSFSVVPIHVGHVHHMYECSYHTVVGLDTCITCMSIATTL